MVHPVTCLEIFYLICTKSLYWGATTEMHVHTVHTGFLNFANFHSGVMISFSEYSRQTKYSYSVTHFCTLRSMYDAERNGRIAELIFYCQYLEK